MTEDSNIQLPNKRIPENHPQDGAVTQEQFDFWIWFVEPFAMEGRIPAWVLLKAADAADVQKDYLWRTRGLRYRSDQEALDDFMTIHWAERLDLPTMTTFLSEPTTGSLTKSVNPVGSWELPASQSSLQSSPSALSSGPSSEVSYEPAQNSGLLRLSPRNSFS